MTIHHIGYAVENIEKAYKIFSLLGYEKLKIDLPAPDESSGGGVCGYENIQDTIDDVDRNIKILILRNKNFLVELISFLDRTKPSPIDFLFKSRFAFPGNGIPYHICYKVSDINKTIDSLNKENFIIIQHPSKAIALGNNFVAFLFHKDIGIIELYEEKVQ
jgi:methylmalonyl-CoA/ethylmalonyl-CoA epimerase